MTRGCGTSNWTSGLKACIPTHALRECCGATACRNRRIAVPHRSHLQQDVIGYADKIEAEMRRIGWWQSEPLRPEQLNFKQAFAMDTMAYTQWLQFIFLPRVREAAAANELPSDSYVGAQAVREVDGYPDAADLVTLLSEFDAIVD